MIRHVTNSEIDRIKWDRFIHESFNGNIYALSGYLDITIPTWEALIKNDYEAVMPLPAGRKFGISYLGTPYLTQQLGVFYTKDYADPTNEFLIALPEKFKWIDCKLNHFNNPEYFPGKVSQYSNFEIDLSFNYSTLKKTFSDNTKRNIKKAQNHNLNIVPDEQPDVIIDLFKADKGKSIPSIKEKNYNTLKAAFSFMKTSSKAHVTCATYNKEIVAGMILFEYKNKRIFIFSGNSNLGKETGAMFFLINDYLEKHAGQNIIFDFEGSNLPTLARFYKGFGAKDFPYPALKLNKLPAPLHLLK
jgi:hypothetical protein